jgi:Plasmid pRiA4b ORF-3-like protein
LVLRGVSPLIVRTIEVPDAVTLAVLHEALLVLFGWSGEQARFSIHGSIPLTASTHEFAGDCCPCRNSDSLDPETHEPSCGAA